VGEAQDAGGGMITVATVLWDLNAKSFPFATAYNEMWVERLYRNFAKHVTRPFRFVVFTDRKRRFVEPAIEQQRLTAEEPDYGCCIEPFSLGVPSIIVGLDTVVTGNIDHLADYCLTGDNLALPRSPGKDFACNGVALVPAGHRYIFDNWRGENDMVWLRRQPHVFIEDLFGPGQVVSYKCHVRPNGLGDAKVVFFHGPPKMDSLSDPWIVRNWQ
jgi:hypothetical protein